MYGCFSIKYAWPHLKIQHLILSLISKENYQGQLKDVHEKPEFHFFTGNMSSLKTCYHQVDWKCLNGWASALIIIRKTLKIGWEPNVCSIFWKLTRENGLMLRLLITKDREREPSMLQLCSFNHINRKIFDHIKGSFRNSSNHHRDLRFGK